MVEGSALINLQKRLDDLALRLSGSDKLLVWQARATLEQQGELIQRIRTAVG